VNLFQKKYKLIPILGVAAAFLFTLSPVSVFAATPISDISDHWAKDQIQSWVDSEYINGYPDGTFKPDNNITRAEFMTIVNHAFGYTEKTEISYSDVTDGMWYTDTISAAKAAGYINGYPDGTMKPNAPITRQEAAVMIGKITGLESDEAAADEFADGKDIPAWSKGSVGACVTAEIFNGYPDGSFLGNNNIKRAESVVALSKALAYQNAPDELAASVYGIDSTGFHLVFSSAVDGLTQGDLTLSQGDNNVSVEAITTEDDGVTYMVAAALTEGQTYHLALSIDGYDFGDGITFNVLTAQEAADEVNTLIAAIPAVDTLTMDDAGTVLAAAISYHSLTEAQQALVTDENLLILNGAVAKMESLEANQ